MNRRGFTSEAQPRSALAAVCAATLALFPALCRAEDGFRIRTTLSSLPDQPADVAGFSGLSLSLPLDGGIYLGATVYSAAFGDAGGVFAGGYELGYRMPIRGRWLLDFGALAGGGGGAARATGGGLLLRPRLALVRGGEYFDASVGLAYYRLYESEIHHLGMELGLEWRAAAAGGTASNGAAAVEEGGRRVAGYGRYYLVRDARKRGGAPLDDFLLVGVDLEAGEFPGGVFFVRAGGAVSGDAEGYAEWLAGLRKRWRAGRVRPRAELGIGVGGGGGVDTGGGAVVSAGAGCDLAAGPVSVGIGGAYVRSLNGDFAALTPSLNLALAFAPEPGRLWIAPSVLSLIENNRLRKQGAVGENVENLGLSVEWEFLPRLYLAGKGYTALAGEAAGFQMGLVGLGADVFRGGRSRVFVEGGVGAGGGAGIDTDEGALGYVRAGGGFDLRPGIEVNGSVAQIAALRGGMDSAALEIGVRRRF